MLGFGGTLNAPHLHYGPPMQEFRGDLSDAGDYSFSLARSKMTLTMPKGAGTEGSWDEKQGTFPRLAVRYRETVDSNIGDHISARLQTIHGFKNVFENPNGLYEGFKAHQLQKCTCSAQDPGFMGGI